MAHACVRAPGTLLGRKRMGRFTPHTTACHVETPLRARTRNSGLRWATPMSLKDGLLRAGAALGSNLVSLTSRPIDHLYSRLSGFNGPFFPQACRGAWARQHARCMAPNCQWAHLGLGGWSLTWQHGQAVPVVPELGADF